MKKLFVSHEIAKQLKDLGFDEKCFNVYDSMGFLQEQNVMNKMVLEYCLAPTYQQVIDWLREKHKIHIYLYLNAGKDAYNISIEYTYFVKEENDIDVINKSYEYGEAREKAILKALELIKK